MIYDNENKRYVPEVSKMSVNGDDYKRGWYDGYHAAMKQMTDTQRHIPPINPFPTQTSASRCKICGIDLSVATHYVCNVSYCPTKVSC